MAREGQHTMRLAVKGDARSADKEMAALAKQTAALDKELAKANRRLVAFDQAQQKAGTSAEKNAQRVQQAQLAQSQSVVDGTRRQREALRATSAVRKSNVKQHIAAIEREKIARLQQIAVEQRFAKSAADAARLSNRADQVRHTAVMQRLEVERAARAQAASAARAREAALTRAATGATIAAVATDQLAQRSFQLANVQANLPFSIEKAQEATAGLVSDFDLMQQAITANRLGVARSSEDFAKMASTAVTLGVAVGQDATASLRDFTNGLGRGSTEVLDNLGITLRASEAHEEYAKSVGKTVGQLTQAEKRQAVINVGLERGADLAARSKIQVEGWAASWERAKVALSNTADAVVQLDSNLRDLSEESLKGVGLTGEQASRAVDNFTESMANTVIDLVPGGAAVRQFSEAMDQLGDETDGVVQTIKRGRPEFSFFRFWLQQTGGLATRTSATLDELGRRIANVADETAFQDRMQRAAAEAALEEKFTKQRLEREDKIADKRAKEQKKRSKDRQRNVAAAQQAAQAELQVNIAAARRERELAERRLEDKQATSEEVLRLIDAEFQAQQELAVLQFQQASTRAEQLRAQVAIEDTIHQGRIARMDAERKAAEDLAEAEKKRADELLKFQRAENAAAVADVGRSNREELAALELQRAQAFRRSGEDPSLGRSQSIQRVRDEVSANERLREVQLQQIEWEIQQTNDRTERLQLESQADQIRHESKLDRIKVEQEIEAQALARERARTQQRLQMRQQLLSQSISFAQGMANVTAGMIRTEKKAVDAARKAGESEAQARARTRGQNLNALGTQLTGQSIAHAAQAVGAAASFNFPGAALHTAAAAALGVAAGIVFARGDQLLARGGGGGGGLSRPSTSAPSFGGGGGPGPDGPPASGGGSIPPSPGPGTTPQPQPGNPAGGAANGPPPQPGERRVTTNNVTINAVTFDRAALRSLRDGLEDLNAQEAS